MSVKSPLAQPTVPEQENKTDCWSLGSKAHDTCNAAIEANKDVKPGTAALHELAAQHCKEAADAHCDAGNHEIAKSFNNKADSHATRAMVIKRAGKS